MLTDVLQSQITRLQEEVRGLASWRTGIVESVDPPTVLFPRDTVATPADTLTQSIQPGAVVLTLTLLRRVWIIGVRGGFISLLSIGDGASTEEPSVSFYRKDPSTAGALSAKLYLANITGGVPSIEIFKDGATAGSFRIYESGRISMQTQGASSTANATRDLPFAVTSGSVYVEALASNTASTFPITFPTNLFTKPPTVVASIRGTSGALRHTVAVMSPTTTTGCTLRAGNFTTSIGASHYIDWIAIQPTV